MTRSDVRTFRPSRRFFALPLALAALASASFAGAANADNYLYWGASVAGVGSIARANSDGTGVNNSWLGTGSTFAIGLAYNDTKLYWATPPISGPSNAVSANLDGTGQSTLLAYPTGFDATPAGLAINSQYLYLTLSSFGGSGPNTNIGRANLDGTGLNQTFIALGSAQVTSVAVDSQYIYYADYVNGSIGRANLDGTGVNASFMTGVGRPLEIAVNGTHIYWVDTVNDRIGRANIDGTGINTALVSATAPDQFDMVAVDSNYLYWDRNQTGSTPTDIARANLDGTSPNNTFITTNTTGPVYAMTTAPAGAAQVKYALTVAKAGTGSGTVTSSPAGIDCGATCSAEYNSGTSVTLTAAPASGSTFSGWSGACSGSAATCTVSISQAQSVTATFAAIQPTPSNAFKLSSPSVAGSGRSIRTRITVTDPGRISQRGTRATRSSSAGAAAAAVCSASKTASKAGTYTLTCTVNSATRKAQKKGSVRVLLRTTFTPSGGTARTVSRTVTLPSLKPKYAG